ncbi:inorganic phosphate transporter [Alistipes sp.]|uniref:inorganic phosphate transporter n=1 Tax=Alistipes sp. TaxID=1872444 RepID=UPI0011C721B4
MTPLFTFIVVVLAVLAVLGIVVGVANDAVNFLNSALGSKVAPRRVILAVAAAGILVGTLTSTGMMEVARSGVFYPGQFTFTEVMMLFLGMMLGNVILLDLFNTLGLPTSTTVSMVFGLLGAAVAAALYRIGTEASFGLADLPQFINSGKAMVIIAAILLSVVLAFAAGIGFMYLSRLLFSFRYAPAFRRLGAVWCGISLAGILYFALFKGLKSSGLIGPALSEQVSQHVFLTLLALWGVSSVGLWVLQRLRVDIMRVTILAGTFALALAFAGNDLVNFIGVPLAGWDSWRLAGEAGTTSLMMEGLMHPARANLLILCGAGVVMVLTLCFSRKAMHVAQTELQLASQHEGEERFGSTALSRSLVRATLGVNRWWERRIPARLRAAIDRRFEPLPAEQRSTASYDMIRAVVNLTAASVLISVATSYKLPLSTTYVVFMVAMGSSLADRSWGRESAVYRITGVMAVISGWFVTALAGFLIACAVTLLLLWGGWIAVVGATALCGWLLVRSHLRRPAPAAPEQAEASTIRALQPGESADEVLCLCTGEVCAVMEQVTRTYNRTLVAVFKENRRVLREVVGASERLFREARDRKYSLVPMLRRIEACDIDTGHFYVQVTDYLSEVSKALLHITRPAMEHISNNHEGLSKEQVVDLMRVNDGVERIFEKINGMLRTKDFSELDEVLRMRDELFGRIAEAVKSQLRRLRDEPGGGTRASMLYLTILNETRTMVLQARNLLKSQRYLLDHRASA